MQCHFFFISYLPWRSSFLYDFLLIAIAFPTYVRFRPRTSICSYLGYFLSSPSTKDLVSSNHPPYFSRSCLSLLPALNCLSFLVPLKCLKAFWEAVPCSPPSQLSDIFSCSFFKVFHFEFYQTTESVELSLCKCWQSYEVICPRSLKAAWVLYSNNTTNFMYLQEKWICEE